MDTSGETEKQTRRVKEHKMKVTGKKFKIPPILSTDFSKATAEIRRHGIEHHHSERKYLVS